MQYASFFCEESARSIGHRSNTLTNHVPIDQKNCSYYNTILERFYCILKILIDHWVSSDCIGSMEELSVILKTGYSISIEKIVWVSKEGNLQDFNNIITWFFICFILSTQTHLTDTLGAVCLWYLHNWVLKRKGVYN